MRSLVAWLSSDTSTAHLHVLPTYVMTPCPPSCAPPSRLLAKALPLKAFYHEATAL